MNPDIACFREVFFEESFEGLAVMESGLLALSEAVNASGSPDAEVVNEVFRAAHSIKGGSGFFNFSDLTDLTHVLETLLDELRCNKRGVSADITSLLLESVDCLRSMLDAERAEKPVDKVRVTAMMDRLREMLTPEPDAGPVETPPPAEAKPADRQAVAAAAVSEPSSLGAPGVGWRIVFRPLPHFFRTGNDPLPLLR